MSETTATASADEPGSSLAAEEEDWLPETSHIQATRRPDYQVNAQPCEACQ